MNFITAILDYFLKLRSMGGGTWQARLFFISIFIFSLSCSIAVILIANNTSLQDIKNLINI